MLDLEREETDFEKNIKGVRYLSKGLKRISKNQILAAGLPLDRSPSIKSIQTLRRENTVKPSNEFLELIYFKK